MGALDRTARGAIQRRRASKLEQRLAADGRATGTVRLHLLVVERKFALMERLLIAPHADADIFGIGIVDNEFLKAFSVPVEGHGAAVFTHHRRLAGAKLTAARASAQIELDEEPLFALEKDGLIEANGETRCASDLGTDAGLFIITASKDHQSDGE